MTRSRTPAPRQTQLRGHRQPRRAFPSSSIPPVDAQGKGKDGKPVDMPHTAELLKAAFASDVGVENDAISLDNGYVWYEVREVVPSALKPLDQVKDQARAAVVAAKVRALSEEKAKKLVERAQSGVKLEDLAAEARRPGADGTGPAPHRKAATASAPPPWRPVRRARDTGFAYALEPDGRGARVMQSQPVLLPPFDPASAEAKRISEKLKGQLADNLLTAYLAALREGSGRRASTIRSGETSRDNRRTELPRDPCAGTPDDHLTRLRQLRPRL